MFTSILYLLCYITEGKFYASNCTNEIFELWIILDFQINLLIVIPCLLQTHNICRHKILKVLIHGYML